MLGTGRKPRICIIGGGFAGLNAAQQFKSSRYDVTVVDPSLHMEWQPNVHEILSGVKKGDELRLNRAILLRRLGHRFVMHKAVEMSTSFVHLDNGERVPFDACIVAVGNVSGLGRIPGAEKYMLPMQTVEQCQAIARRLYGVTLGHRTARVTVVGGGVEAVEGFGEILRTYRERPQFDFSVVDAADRLLSHCPGNLDTTIRQHTRRYRVEYQLEKTVEEVDADGLCFADGSALQSNITIWGGRGLPNPFLRQSLLTQADDWPEVNGAFQSTRRENVFVIGDAARSPAPALSMQSSQAAEMGRVTAGNVERLLAGRPLRDFMPVHKPQLVTFGDMDTFMLFRDFALSSSVLGVAREAMYNLGLLQMAPPRSARELLHTLEVLQRGIRKVYLPTFNPFGLVDKLNRTKMLS